ncbi:MAG: ATP-binding protein [Bacteroidales bacterium]|nr:ATP-binding protein [Bacteroidales bacterium]
MNKSKRSFLVKHLIILLLSIGTSFSFLDLKAESQAANPSEIVNKIEKIQQQLSKENAASLDSAALIQSVNLIAVELLQSTDKQQTLAFLHDFKSFLNSNTSESDRLNYNLFCLLAANYQENPDQIKSYLQLAVKSGNPKHIEMAYLLLANHYIYVNQTAKAELFLSAASQDLAQFTDEVSWNRNLLELALKLSTGLKTDSIEYQLIKTIDNQNFDLFQSWIVERFILQHTFSPALLDALNQAIEKSGNKKLKALIYQKKADEIFEEDPETASVLYQSSIQLFDEFEAERQLFQNQLLENWHQIKSASDKNESTPIYWELFLVGVLLSCIIYLINKLIRHKKSSRQQLRQQEIAIDQLSQRVSKAENEFIERVKDREISLKNELVEIAKLDIELKAALKRMEEANYLKNAFMANMSHEIRTPLNGILGFASLLGYELAVIDKPELHEYASSIQKSGDKLLHLLNNIIDISRLQANDMETKKQNCHLSSLVEAALAPLQTTTQQKGIQLISLIPDEVVTLTDHEILSRVVAEILDNSVKYTEKGYVKITAALHLDQKQIELVISDTGTGIDKAYQAQIFEPFRQDNQSYSKQYQGAGLGLPLAKRLIDLLGGRLEILSEKTKGTSITIYLPQAESNQKKNTIYTTIPAKPKGFITKKLRILLVEDDKSNLIVLTQLLKKYGQVEQAADGAIALKAVVQSIQENNLFDLFFIDINLPAPWDGVKLMHFIKANHSIYAQTPFVAQTAYGMAGDKDRFMREGFNGYIAKPMKPDELALLIESFQGIAIENKEI